MQLTSFLSSKLIFFSLGSIARTLCSLELFYFVLLHFMFLVSFFRCFLLVLIFSRVFVLFGFASGKSVAYPNFYRMIFIIKDFIVLF